MLLEEFNKEAKKYGSKEILKTSHSTKGVSKQPKEKTPPSTKVTYSNVVI